MYVNWWHHGRNRPIMALIDWLKKQKNAGDFQYTTPPTLYSTYGLSTLYRCSLTTVAQTKPYHEKPFNQGLLQPQGALYSFQTIINHRSRNQINSPGQSVTLSLPCGVISVLKDLILPHLTLQGWFLKRIKLFWHLTTVIDNTWGTFDSMYNNCKISKNGWKQTFKTDHQRSRWFWIFQSSLTPS